MHIVGWISSVILVGGVVAQVWRQWSEGTSKGVSPWLFIAQIAANSGFAAYGISREDPVVVITGAAMALCSFVGLGILIWHRKRTSRNGSREHKDARLAHH